MSIFRAFTDLAASLPKLETYALLGGLAIMLAMMVRTPEGEAAEVALIERENPMLATASVAALTSVSGVQVADTSQ